METINVRSRCQTEFIDITDRVQDAIKGERISDGVSYVYVSHTTAGLTINENADPSVHHDIVMALDRIVPDDQPYRHMEGNSPAHIKASLMGSSITVFVKSGQLVLGTLQGIYFCEFDGPRTRRVYVKGLDSRS